MSPKRAEVGRDRSGGCGRRLLVPLAAVLAVAVVPGWTIAGAAERPEVQVFENEPPSVDQLRGIIVPESRSRGLSRKIEIPSRTSIGGPSYVQPAAATAPAPAPAPAQPVVTETRVSPPAAEPAPQPMPSRAEPIVSAGSTARRRRSTRI